MCELESLTCHMSLTETEQSPKQGKVGASRIRISVPVGCFVADPPVAGHPGHPPSQQSASRASINLGFRVKEAKRPDPGRVEGVRSRTQTWSEAEDGYLECSMVLSSRNSGSDIMASF